MLNNIVRALRLPFLSASILPFVFGSLIARDNFNLGGFIFGLIAAACAHLAANLMNDYADSKSGADWQDKRFFGFFGGSKLIQEKVFSEAFYLKLAFCFAAISGLCVISLALILKDSSVLSYYFAIIFLSWAYSSRPLKLSYRRLGEAVIFILFGPACVMGGYFIQTGIFPDSRSFILSLPFGLLTTAILFANEVPDYIEDSKAGKNTWVSITGDKYAYLIYCFLVILVFLSIAASIISGYLSLFAGLSFILIFIVFKAAGILKKYYNDKERLVASSGMTIALQTLTGIILIIALII